MAELYIMRHGQTLFNQNHQIQGWCDSPLTPLGIEQAKAAGKLLRERNLVFDHAYSSTSERACDTLELVTEGKMPYERVKGLKEINFGKFEGMSEVLNPPLPYGDFFKVYGGGESIAETQARLVKTITDLMNREGHNCVLMVTHGGALANFAKYFDSHALESAHYRTGIKNCSIFHYRYENGIFCCLEIIEGTL